jgi:predicted nucleic acid-binding protein
MTLVDTSVWVDHFRRGNRALEALLLDGEVLCHPFVIGELACGNLRKRSETLGLLRALPGAPLADSDDVLTLIDRHRLTGTGLGWVDVHILSSALLAHTRLWTLDRPLARAAHRLELLPSQA